MVNDADGKVVVADGSQAIDTGEYADIRKEVKDLRMQVDTTSWALSQALYGVYKESLYTSWGFSKWKDYIDQELDFSSRTAYELVRIQEWFSQMSSETQGWVQALGWSKAKEIVGVVNDENLAEWKSRLEGKTVKQIQDILKNKGGEGEDGEEGSSGSGADYDDQDERPVKVALSLYSEQKENYDNALKHAASVADSDKPGHLIDLICTSYIATNVGIESVQTLLVDIERQIGLKLIAFDVGADAIVFGNETLDSMVKAEE